MSASALTIHPTPAGVRFDIRVIPRSPRTEVGGIRAGRVVVRVTAAPVDHAANAAVIAAVASAAGVARRAVSIVAGATSRNKSIEIAGLRSDAAALARLSHPILRA